MLNELKSLTFLKPSLSMVPDLNKDSGSNNAHANNSGAGVKRGRRPKAAADLQDGEEDADLEDDDEEEPEEEEDSDEEEDEVESSSTS